MKIISFCIFFYLLLLHLNSCSSVLSDSAPGTLGSIEYGELNCSIDIVAKIFLSLSNSENFKVLTKDTIATNWWSKNGFDFLTYRCLNIKKRLYMITLYSDDSNLTSINIRAYYNRLKKKWIFVKKFNTNEKHRAEKDMERLYKEFDLCK